MPRARKTIDIAEVRRMANHFLEHSLPERTAERRATANFLESMLSYSSNYQGFRYLEYNGDPNLGDETRRYYY